MDITFGELFPLTAADLSAPKPPVAAGTPPLKRIRAVHHQVARLLASGMKQSEVSLHTGFCASRLSILKNDPSFNELVSHYQTVEEEVFVDTRKRVAALGVSVAEVLHDRVLESPDDMSTKELTNLLSAALDRGGFAPVQRSITTTTNMTPEDIAAIKDALGNAPRRERLIEGEYSSEPANTTPGMGSDLSETIIPSEAAEGSSGEGTGV